jgi:hypothetical protein
MSLPVTQVTLSRVDANVSEHGREQDVIAAPEVVDRSAFTFEVRHRAYSIVHEQLIAAPV